MNKLARNIFKFKPLTHLNKYNLYLHEYQAYEILKKYGLPLVPVIFTLCRVLEPQLQMMPTLSPIDSCPKLLSQSLLLMSLSKHKYMLEEEARVHSDKLVSRVVFKLPLRLHKYLIMLRKCWERLWSPHRQVSKARKSTKFFWLRRPS